MCGGGLAQPVSAHHLLQAALCVCAAMAVRPTEAQLLALPEHSLAQGAAGRVRAAQGPVALPALQAGSFWHSLLREWLPGPLPSWTWSGPGLRLLSSTTFTAFFVGQLKRGSRIRRGGSTAPAVSVRIYSPCFPCFPAFPPAVCNTTPSHALLSLFCRAGDTRQRQRVLRHEQPGELRFHPAEKSFSRWTGENEESVKPDPPQNCQTGVLE